MVSTYNPTSKEFNTPLRGTKFFNDYIGFTTATSTKSLTKVVGNKMIVCFM